MTESAEPREPGTILTFYSYKGGTGRSMALANVAWILASNGYRVLVVDWDLEAPGLHRYFAPFLLDPELTESEGVIDIVDAYVTAAMTKAEGTASEDWPEEYANILRYATSLDYPFEEHAGRKGWIDFIPAGRQGAAYATRMNSFSWQNFYDRFGGGGFIERVRARMKAEYDYVLIDSRTGVSDTSGICTVQLPDVLAVCFTLNRQSIEGASAVAASVRAQRGEGRPLEIFPIPTRVEKAEKERLDVAREVGREAFASLWTTPGDMYWGDVEIFYEPFYAYEEVLAVFGDKPDQPSSLLASMERITMWLTGWKVRQLVPVDESKRQTVLAKYARQSRKSLAKADPATPHAEYLFYVSYSRSDLDEHLERFIDDLSERVRNFVGRPAAESVGFVDYASLGPADLWSTTITEALRRSHVLVPLMSPALFDSEFAGRELQHFLDRGTTAAIRPVLWVRPTEEAIPDVLAKMKDGSEAFPGPYSNLGLSSLMRLRRYRDEYLHFVDAFARLVVKAAEQSPLPETDVRPLEELPNAFEPIAPPPPTPAPQPPATNFRAIAGSIPKRDRQSVIDILDDNIIPAIRTGSTLPPLDDAQELLLALSSCRLYDLMERTANELLNAGLADPTIQLLYARALFEQEKTSAALAVLARIERPGFSAKMLIGEAYTRLYVEAAAPNLPRNQQNLARAVGAFEEVFTMVPSEFASGMNLAALLIRAERDNVRVKRTSSETPSSIAERILDQIETRVSHGTATPEDYAVAATASFIARPEETWKWIASYVDEPAVDAYAISKLLWQFTELWKVEDPVGRATVSSLRSEILTREGGSLTVPGSVLLNGPSVLAAVPTPLEDALALADAVARIEDYDGSPLGTGFVLGDHLLTCMSVIEPPGRTPRVFATFEAANVRFELGVPSFKSGRGALDLVIFPIDLSGGPVVTPYMVAATPPNPSDRVLIIGYPSDRALTIAMHTRSVLDVSLPRIHYRAPAMPGMAGAPVFNESNELVAIHHATDAHMLRLGGKPGSYEASEGIWIGSIVREVNVRS